ncbi:MAG: DNA-binding response regulator [Daejeonella sp.]|nr:DNA-binding response regulator [Daejeonella sp.]
MKISCLIIDDEPLAIKVLESHSANVDFLDIRGTFFNAIDAYSFLQKESVDLIFLDIKMPKLTGLEFLRTLQNPPQVIITTAYREFAMEGYEFNVADYLLKPISFERFLKAVNKIPSRILLAEPASINDVVKGLDHIFFKCDKKMVKFFFDEILFIESIKDYVRVKARNKDVITYYTMTALEEILPSQFIRIHKSFIVNQKNIDSFSNSFIGINNQEIPLGRLYKNQALMALSNPK